MAIDPLERQVQIHSEFLRWSHSRQPTFKAKTLSLLHHWAQSTRWRKRHGFGCDLARWKLCSNHCWLSPGRSNILLRNPSILSYSYCPITELVFPHDNELPTEIVLLLKLSLKLTSMLQSPVHPKISVPNRPCLGCARPKLTILFDAVSIFVLRQRLIEQWKRTPHHQFGFLCDSLPQRMAAFLCA